MKKNRVTIAKKPVYNKSQVIKKSFKLGYIEKLKAQNYGNRF